MYGSPPRLFKTKDGCFSELKIGGPVKLPDVSHGYWWDLAHILPTRLCACRPSEYGLDKATIFQLPHCE